MKKMVYLIIRLLSMASLLLAALILIIYLTQAKNIQIIPLQIFYWSLDREWGLGRATVNFLVALAAIIMVISSSQKLNPKEFGTLVLISICGLVLGLIYYSTERCCENPLILGFGFPFSWWRGVTDSLHTHSSSLVGYLLQNRDQIYWSVYLWGLIVDLLFWLNLSFLILSIPKLKRASNSMEISG